MNLFIYFQSLHILLLTDILINIEKGADMRAGEFIILVESRSYDLYHGTDLDSAESILRKNFMKARKENLDGMDNIDGVSLTRNFNAALGFASMNEYTEEIGGVIFVLDQPLLMQDYGKKLRPFNYPMEPDQDHEDFWYLNDKEAEERIFSNLSNVNKYIKEIIIPVHPKLMNKAVRIIKSEAPTVYNHPKLQFIDYAVKPDSQNAEIPAKPAVIQYATRSNVALSKNKPLKLAPKTLTTKKSRKQE